MVLTVLIYLLTPFAEKFFGCQWRFIQLWTIHFVLAFLDKYTEFWVTLCISGTGTAAQAGDREAVVEIWGGIVALVEWIIRTIGDNIIITTGWLTEVQNTAVGLEMSDNNTVGLWPLDVKAKYVLFRVHLIRQDDDANLSCSFEACCRLPLFWSVFILKSNNNAHYDRSTEVWRRSLCKPLDHALLLPISESYIDKSNLSNSHFHGQMKGSTKIEAPVVHFSVNMPFEGLGMIKASPWLPHFRTTTAVVSHVLIFPLCLDMRPLTLLCLDNMRNI